MFLGGLRSMKSLKDSFELSSGGNAKRIHLSFVKQILGLFLKRL
jgi:hypothetical protein